VDQRLRGRHDAGAPSRLVDGQDGHEGLARARRENPPSPEGAPCPE
jgi:hypothetical protein